MKITKCTFTGPDSDGDLRFDVEASVENKCDHEVNLSRRHVLFWTMKAFVVLVVLVMRLTFLSTPKRLTPLI